MIPLLVSITLAVLCCALVAKLERQRLALTDVRARFDEAHAEWTASLAREEVASARAETALQLAHEAQEDCRNAIGEWTAALDREAELREALTRVPRVQRQTAEA